MLEVRNLTFGYNNCRPIINDVSLTIKPGDVTVLIGPSGTGKTTLLRCLALLEQPRSGQITVDGQEFSYPWERGVEFVPPWPTLTTVFQQLFLWPHLTLRENVLLPVRLRAKAEVGGDSNGRINHGNAPVRLEALIEAFDMGDFINRYPNEASLGQRQRVALARALLLQPKYLLLDEITSALDVEQIAKILGYIKQLRGQNIGVFIITHLLGFARHAADQVLFMCDGTIGESGSPDILRNPQTERLQQFLSVIAAAS